LGLAICRRLCELLGGRIWVEEPDAARPGATVVFTWLADADETTLTPAPATWPHSLEPDRRAEPDSPTPHGRPDGERAGSDGLRILIAEDNLMNQQVAVLLLAAMGHDAHVVGTGDEAILAVQAVAYDVVLMDVAMPGTDGLSATRAIRQLGTAIAQPYIVALTAHAFPGDAETCIDAGMDDYVAKPIERAKLARALEAGARRRAGAGGAGNGRAPAPGWRPAGPAGLAGSAGAAGTARAAEPGWSMAPAGTAEPLVPAGPAVPAGPLVPAGPAGAAESAAGAGLDDRSSFDPSIPLDLLAQYGPDAFGQLVDIFRAEAVRTVAAASDAVADGRVEAAEMAAHRLKSSAANLGAQALFTSCTQLELLARSGSLAGAEQLTAAMDDQLVEALGRLEAMLAEYRLPEDRLPEDRLPEIDG
jgi:CheY-like chemotaxis protein/HPt (histidine-containing phosphotransfer) domain-containing protein